MKRNLVFALTLSLTFAFSTAAFAESSTEAASETETTEAASAACHIVHHTDDSHHPCLGNQA